MAFETSGDATMAAVQRSVTEMLAAEEDGKPRQHAVVFVSNNADKARELQEILAARAVCARVLRVPLDLVEIQGTREEVVTAKCLLAKATAAKVLDELQAHGIEWALVVEDTSLCFRAWNAMPGVYIKWFSGSTAKELSRMLAGFEDKGASAHCMIALMTRHAPPVPVCFHGELHGVIVDESEASLAGSSAWDWDTVFRPDGHDTTFAGMTRAAKNSISHRYLATVQLIEHLSTIWPDLVSV